MTAKKRTNPLKRTTTDATKAKLPKPRKRKAAGLPQNLAWRVINREPGQPEFVPPRLSAPCMDWPADSLPSGVARVTDAAMLEFSTIPDTAPYPWPVRVREWLVDLVEPLRWWLALKLKRLAHWVAP